MELYLEFETSQEVTSQNKCKSSVERKIREDILESYPRIADVIDEIWPKKEGCLLGKTKGKITGGEEGENLTSVQLM